MTFLEMQTSLGYLLNESVPSQWTAEERKSWLNEGQYDFSSKVVDDALLPLVVESFANSVASQSDYDFPTGFLRMREVAVGSVYYKPIDMFSVKVISDPNSFWTPSTTEGYFIIVNNKIRLFPTPTANGTNNIKYWYTKYPTVLSADSETSIVPVQYHQHIVLYACVKAQEKYGLLDKASALLAEYHAHIQAINQRYLGMHGVENADPTKDSRGVKK